VTLGIVRNTDANALSRSAATETSSVTIAALVRTGSGVHVIKVNNSESFQQGHQITGRDLISWFTKPFDEI